MKRNPLLVILTLLLFFATQAKAQQLKLLNLNQPYAVTFSGTNQNVIVEFKNIGAVTVTTAKFDVLINGTPGINNVWNGSLTSGSKTSFNIGNITVPSGTSDLSVLVWDANGTSTTYADTVLFKIQTPGVLGIPYTDDFEGVIKWSASSFTPYTGYNPSGWQLGIPNYGAITPSPTPTAWVMGLDSGYDNDIQTYLYSPVFNFASSGVNAIWMHFSVNANLAANDNLTVEYTTDFLTWTQLPIYTVTGNTGGWTGMGSNVGALLSSYAQVQFRFVFNSDGSGTSDGVAIDDFQIVPCIISQINMNQLTPVSCFGMCDGVLDASPQVGYPPFTYQWGGGETTQSINVCAGTYDVTVTDVNGCTGQASQTVVQPLQLSASLPSSFTICQGDSAVLCPNPTGGTPPYTYLWNTGEITPCITLFISGNYSVTIYDANGCSVTENTVVTVNPAPIVSLGPDAFICVGASVLLDAGSGYSAYQWSTSEITQTILAIIGGVYTVTVTDGNGCTGSDEISITQSSPTPVISGNAIICPGSVVVLDAGLGYVGYLWSNGSINNYILDSLGGTYTVTVTDANGCSGSASVTTTLSTQIFLTLREDYNCNTGTSDLYAIGIGGSGGYSYIWVSGQTTNPITNAVPGQYTAIVTDINGCSTATTGTVLGFAQESHYRTEPECAGYQGNIFADYNGVTPLGFQWSNGSMMQTLIAQAGIYTCTITDAVGCTVSFSDTLTDPDPIVLTLDSVIASGCGLSNGSFYYSFTPGAFSIPWVNGVQFGSTTNLDTGIYYIYIIQNVCASNTLQIVVPDSCADVWPGDANYDLVADNKDLLQIGLAYGNTGPVRPSASNSWVAQPAPDWSNWFNIGVNQKHADCDGNGIVDAADTIPILLNYGLTHPLKPIIIPQVNTLAPDLYLVITQDTTGLSDSIFVNVLCGTATNPVDSIYGLAFRLYYDSALVDTSSIFFDINNSFIGTAGTNAISINKNFGVGYADFAITRTDHNNTSGFGPVCVMGIVTTDNVAGKMLTPVNAVLRFSLGDVYAVTANENPVVLDVFGDSIFVDSNLTAINYLNWQREVRIYPNPANNYFTITSSLTNISKISMLNQFGEVIYKNEKPRLPQRINVSNTTNGIYFLRIESKEGVMYRKIEIIK